ncbi:MAG: GlsB/YeaQ/YmgE family stress response membrane protein [Planctomycetota bacterium]
MAIIWWLLVVGLVSGFLANALMGRSKQGLVVNLVLGILGALVGGFLLRVLGFAAQSLLAQIVSATLGALVLIALVRWMSSKKI